MSIVTYGYGSGLGSIAAANPPDVVATVINATTIRLTITGAAGVTVRSYYSTVSLAGEPWTAGGTRSGNGTIDITVVEGVQYYLWVLADNGVFSIPSNLIEMNTSAGSGTARIIGFGFPKLIAQPKTKVDALGEVFIEAQYYLGPLTLEQANLENGDYLPADALHEIVANTWEIIRSRRKKFPNSNAEVAICQARAVRQYEESGPT